MLSKLHRNKGFTLVELMIVVVIIGILAALAIPRFMSSTVKAKQSEAKQLIKQVFTLENAYRQEYDTYTSNTLSLGFSVPGNARYAIKVTQTSGTYFLVVASSATNLDNDAAHDEWSIDTSGIIICVSDDAANSVDG